MLTRVSKHTAFPLPLKLIIGIIMQEWLYRQVLPFVKARQIVWVAHKGSVPLKLFNFLRINTCSRNQPFINLQSYDN